MRKSLLLLTTLMAGLMTASAAVTPLAWYRMGEAGTAPNAFYLDSTTNLLNFTTSFENSAVYAYNAAAITNIAAGGPLGPNQITSTKASMGYLDGSSGKNGEFLVMTTNNAWSLNSQSNWVVECWILPKAGGTIDAGKHEGCIVCMGQCGQSPSTLGGFTNWGVQFWVSVTNDPAFDPAFPSGNPYSSTVHDGYTTVQCWAVGPNSANNNPATSLPYYLDVNGLPWNFQLGTNYLITSPTNNQWTHLAAVRDNAAQTVTFYVNGHIVGQTNASRVWQPPLLSVANGGPLLGNYTNSIRPTLSTQNISYNTFNSYPYGPNPILAGGVSVNTGSSGNRDFNGYVDELRFSTFAEGAFTTNDLLLRSVPGPGIVKQPVNAIVYSGQPAVLQVIDAYDSANTYQWWKVVGGSLTAISGTTTTSALLVVPTGSYANGDQFVCQLHNSSGTVFTTTNSVTTVSNPSSIVSDYHTTVQAESSLLAYYPVDGDSATGTTLTDVKGGINGTISGNAHLDGSTTRFRAGTGLTFNQDGRLQNFVTDDVTIPNSGTFDFANGYGTIEAVIYMDPVALNEQFAMNFPYQLYGYSFLCSADLSQTNSKTRVPANPLNFRYVLSADAYGHLIFQSPYVDPINALDSPPISWNVPGGTLGRTLHVAFAFDNVNGTVTAYVNGQNLGKKSGINTPALSNILGAGTGFPVHIGNASYSQALINTPSGSPLGFTNEGWTPAVWYGSVDEIAFYGTNLSDGAIAKHSFTYFNGAASTPATVTMLTPSKSMYAGGSENFAVLASGSAPFTYQWYTNSTTNVIGTAVTGATNVTFTLSNITANVSVSCVVQGAAGGPATSVPSLISITTPVGGSYAARVMNDAPVAFYRFNETNGNVAFDWAGSHDGTYSGAYVKNLVGPNTGEGAVQFLGTNAVGGTPSQILIANAPELMGAANRDGQCTYECWFQPYIERVDQYLISGQFYLGNNRAGIQLLYDNDDAEKGNGGQGGNARLVENSFEGQYGRYANVNQYGRIGKTPSQHEVSNVWHHIVVTFATTGSPTGSGSSLAIPGVFTMYVDGFQVAGGTSGNANEAFYPNTVNNPNGSHYAANYYADLILGNIPIGQYVASYTPPIGLLGDVAIYTYALSSNQVVAHYSAYFTPATVALAPVNTTANEGYNNSILLTSQITGTPNTYQWFQVVGGVSNALSSSVLNMDGTPHYPVVNNGVYDTQGVDGPNLLITEVTPNDTGNYVLVTYNSLNTNTGGQLATTPVVVTVVPDTNKPVVTAVAALGQYIYGSSGAPGAIQVRFNKRIDATSATTLGNYSISGPGGVTINSAIQSRSSTDTGFGGDQRNVTLLTSTLTQGASYSVTVTGVKDQSLAGNICTNTTVAVTAPTLKPGLTWDFYPNIPGNMPGLTGGQYYNTVFEFSPPIQPFWAQDSTNTFPFVPEDETTLSSFDESKLFGGGNSLGCNLVYGTGAAGTGLDTNYGVIISGWITPTRTDTYRFFLEADDSAALFLSTDNTPANAQFIAQATGPQSAYYEPGDFRAGNATSASISLTAGQPYWVELVHYQVNGAGYASVAWRSAAGPDSGTPAANLTPMSSQYLSAYSQALPALTISSKPSLNWTGYGHLLQSTNISLPMTNWPPVGRTVVSPFTVTNTGTQKFYRVVK